MEFTLPRDCFETFTDWIEMWTELYLAAAGLEVKPQDARKRDME